MVKYGRCSVLSFSTYDNLHFFWQFYDEYYHLAEKQFKINTFQKHGLLEDGHVLLQHTIPLIVSLYDCNRGSVLLTFVSSYFFSFEYFWYPPDYIKKRTFVVSKYQFHTFTNHHDVIYVHQATRFNQSQQTIKQTLHFLYL